MSTYNTVALLNRCDIESQIASPRCNFIDKVSPSIWPYKDKSQDPTARIWHQYSALNAKKRELFAPCWWGTIKRPEHKTYSNHFEHWLPTRGTSLFWDRYSFHGKRFETWTSNMNELVQFKTKDETAECRIIRITSFVLRERPAQYLTTNISIAGHNLNAGHSSTIIRYT